MARKDVRRGDTVIVLRAGDVIPEVVSVRLRHFASRRAMDIAGLGHWWTTLHGQRTRPWWRTCCT